MQTTVENTEKHTVKLTVEIPPDEYSKELDATYRSIANQVKIPGFRKGKVPKRSSTRRSAATSCATSSSSTRCRSTTDRRVSEQDLAPIADPEIDLEGFTDDSPLVFTATVEVRPRLELTEADYTGLKVTRPSAEVTEADIDEWIDRLRERFAELEPAERPVHRRRLRHRRRQGDRGRRGDRRAHAHRLPLLRGLRRVRRGARRSSSPARSPATSSRSPRRWARAPARTLQGKIADLTVLVKDVKARRLPEVDDDFAKTASEFDTIEQLRDDLRTRLGEMKEREADRGAARPRARRDGRHDRGRHPRDADRRRDRASGRAGRGARRARRPHARGPARGPGVGRGAAARGFPRPRDPGDQGRPGARRRRAGREDRGHRRRAGRRDHFPRSGVRPRLEGARETARANRSDRDAGRGYHQGQGPRSAGRTRRDR